MKSEMDSEKRIYEKATRAKIRINMSRRQNVHLQNEFS